MTVILRRADEWSETQHVHIVTATMHSSNSPPMSMGSIDMNDPDFVGSFMMSLWNKLVPAASNIEWRSSEIRKQFFHEGSASLSWVRRADGGRVGLSVRTARRPEAIRPMVGRDLKIRGIGTECDEVTFCLGDPDDAHIATFNMPLDALLGLVDRSMDFYELSDGSVMTADTQNQLLELATINIVTALTTTHSIMCVMKEAVIREYWRLVTVNGANAYGDRVFAPENNTYTQMGSEESMMAFLRSKETEEHLRGTSARSVLERLKILMSTLDYCIEHTHLRQTSSAPGGFPMLDPTRSYATVQQYSPSGDARNNVALPPYASPLSLAARDDDSDSDEDMSRGTESSASSMSMYSSGESSTTMTELRSPAPSPTIQHPNIKIPIERAMEFTAGYDVPTRPSRLRGAMIAVSRGGTTFQELRSTVVPPRDPKPQRPYLIDVSIISFITDDVNYNAKMVASSENTLLEIETSYYNMTFADGKKHPVVARSSLKVSWMFTANWERITRQDLATTKLSDIAIDNPYFVTIYMSLYPNQWPAAFRNSPYKELMIQKRDENIFGETAQWWS